MMTREHSTKHHYKSSLIWTSLADKMGQRILKSVRRGNPPNRAAQRVHRHLQRLAHVSGLYQVRINWHGMIYGRDVHYTELAKEEWNRQ